MTEATTGLEELFGEIEDTEDTEDIEEDKHFTIFHDTEGTQWSGCDEILQTIQCEDIQEAMNWTDLWCGYDDVTRICGKKEEWRKKDGKWLMSEGLYSKRKAISVTRKER